VSTNDAWKALHLLYVGKTGPVGLTWDNLSEAGVRCHEDTMDELTERGVINKVNDTYVVSPATRFILNSFLVSRRQFSGDLWVDYPAVFAVMPFREDWSQRVYDDLIRPAAFAAGYTCGRADEHPAIGDIREGLWRSLLQAGVIIADISVPNPNVFFEIGLASGLGKDPLLLKRKDTPLPADFGGARYLEYDIDDLAKGRDLLKRQLIEWANIRGMGGVKEVVDANHRGRPNR
jgi:hypothetical protein